MDKKTDSLNRKSFLKKMGILTVGGMLFPFYGCKNESSVTAGTKSHKTGTKYYIDSHDGDDTNTGKSPDSAWKTLHKASSWNYKAGDTLLLKRGHTYLGTLALSGITGSRKNPFDVDSFGSGSLPHIDASGYLAGISIKDSKYLNIHNLEISSDAGTLVDQAARTKRYGVLIEANSPGEYSHIRLINLQIHDIFANDKVPSDGRNLTSNKGMGIATFSNGTNKATLSFISIKDCTIKRTGFTGIAIHDRSHLGINQYSTKEIEIVNNILKEIGGPGMNMDNTKNVLVRSNTVDGSGSSADPRMHGRGSGIWPWTSNNVLIEYNKFMHARGKMDSCGAHIDFNNKNVVIQYNLSLDNEGGFIEILGNTYNSCYRYNVSINDGSRVKGVNGARQDGHILWLSNYTGKNGQKLGPYNTYIYNNTIFVDKNQRADFHIMDTAEGFLIANNIFDVRGETSVEISPRVMASEKNKIERNVYHTSNMISLSRLDTEPLSLNDMGFHNPGGLKIVDYIPEKGSLLNDKGRSITKLPGDSIGLEIGLQVSKDILGNRIKGTPDLGAIEYK